VSASTASVGAESSLASKPQRAISNRNFSVDSGNEGLKPFPFWAKIDWRILSADTGGCCEQICDIFFGSVMMTEGFIVLVRSIAGDLSTPSGQRFPKADCLRNSSVRFSNKSFLRLKAQRDTTEQNHPGSESVD
jgi:hypothetical protein